MQIGTVHELLLVHVTTFSSAIWRTSGCPLLAYPMIYREFAPGVSSYVAFLLLTIIEMYSGNDSAIVQAARACLDVETSAFCPGDCIV